MKKNLFLRKSNESARHVNGISMRMKHTSRPLSAVGLGRNDSIGALLARTVQKDTSPPAFVHEKFIVLSRPVVAGIFDRFSLAG
jgi:hypothetical protein